MKGSNGVKTFSIKTFGCKVNQYESQVIRERFIANGYKEISNGDSPDLCIVNTCCVTGHAESESRRFANKAKRIYPDSKVIVTGCSADYRQEDFKDTDCLIPNERKDSIINILNKTADEAIDKINITSFAEHTRAFIKIQDGCNQFCSYCIVPHIRGRARSRDLEDIITEVRNLVSNGYREIVLTGIHLGDYDKFGELIEKLEVFSDLLRVRLSSIEPQDLKNEIIEAISKSSKICRHFHIPLQSGSDKVLKRMNRRYNYEQYKKIINDIKDKMPDIVFTTDIIVGFPGESDDDFKLTCNAIKDIGFAKVHIFPYSDRKGTKAFDFIDKIDSKKIKERVKILKTTADKAVDNIRKEMIGSIQEVLVENRNNVSNGYTSGYLPVHINADLKENTVMKVKITNQTKNSLIGKIFS